MILPLDSCTGKKQSSNLQQHCVLTFQLLTWSLCTNNCGFWSVGKLTEWIILSPFFVTSSLRASRVWRGTIDSHELHACTWRMRVWVYNMTLYSSDMYTYGIQSRILCSHEIHYKAYYVFTSVNMSSSWVMIATCFHSKCCISFTIPGAMLVSEGTGRRKVGKLSTLDNRGDVEVVETCIIIWIHIDHENDDTV